MSMTNDAEVLDALNFDPPCQSKDCAHPGIWAGTCVSCRMVTVLCEGHLRYASRRTVNGATCVRCRRSEESLTALWRLDRTDRR